MKVFWKWVGNHSTNLLATAYIIVVQVITPIFHICKIWAKGDWPVKCLMAIDKPAKALSQLLAKKKAEDAAKEKVEKTTAKK